MLIKLLNRKGTAITEFAVVLPVLFLVFTAMIEIGRMLLLQQTADTAAYEGARHAMVPGATADEAIAAARRLLTASNIKSAEITIDPPQIEEKTGAISVHVSLPLSKNCWFFKTWSSSFDVSSDATLICEREPMVQLTGLPELTKKGGGGGKGSKIEL